MPDQFDSSGFLVAVPELHLQQFGIKVFSATFIGFANTQPNTAAAVRAMATDPKVKAALDELTTSEEARQEALEDPQGFAARRGIQLPPEAAGGISMVRNQPPIVQPGSDVIPVGQGGTQEHGRVGLVVGNSFFGYDSQRGWQCG
jgi:hypothetical protein